MFFANQKLASKFIRKNSSYSYVDTHVHFDAVLKKLKKDLNYFPEFFNKMNGEIKSNEKCEAIVHVSCSTSQKGIKDSLELIKNENGKFNLSFHYSVVLYFLFY